MGKFFSKVACVYLDQFAVNALFDDSVSQSEDWKEIGYLLSEGVRRGRIVCPYSAEHAMETSVKRQESAISQDILFSQLARNLRIRNEPDIMTRQAIALIRNKGLSFKPDLLYIIVNSTVGYSKLFANLIH